MMTLENFTLPELHQLQKDLPAEIARREAVARNAVVAEMRALAEARGFVFEDLMGSGSHAGSSAKKSGKPVAVKYRHPENVALTWPGRGRKPHWVVQWEKGGKSLAALAVA